MYRYIYHSATVAAYSVYLNTTLKLVFFMSSVLLQNA